MSSSSEGDLRSPHHTKEKQKSKKASGHRSANKRLSKHYSENEDDSAIVDKGGGGSQLPIEATPPESPENKPIEAKFFNFSRLKETVGKVQNKGKTLLSGVGISTRNSNINANADDKSESEDEIESKSSEIQIPIVETSENESRETFKTTSSALLLAHESTGQLRSETSFWNVLVYGEAKQTPKADVEQFRKILYTPSRHPVPLAEKLPDHANPRNPEEEGLFVGQPLRISFGNLNRLENRLLKENALMWFGQDGHIKAFPDPYRPEPVQFLYNEDLQVMESLAFFLARRKESQKLPLPEVPDTKIGLDTKSSYQMTLMIGAIAFVHHHTLSREEYLVRKLEAKLDERNRRQEFQLELAERAENKLKALREALSHTKEMEQNLVRKIEEGVSIEVMPEEKAELTQCRNRLRRYRSEMKATRLERDQAHWDDKNMIESALSLWKDIKSLREELGHANSNIKLNIITLEENFSSAKRKWNEDIEQEFEDLKEEFETNYQIELNKYRRNLKTWMESKRRGSASPLPAEKPYRERKEKGKGDESQSNEEKSESSEYSLSEKPIPPQKFDPVQTKHDISDRFRQVRRLPGEPKIVLELVKTGHITPTNELPVSLKAEILRRAAARKVKVQLAIYFNGKEIFKSERKRLTNYYTNLGFTIPVEINEWPKSLVIHMFSGKLKSQKGEVCEINVPLPSRNASIDRSQMQKLDFCCEDSVTPGAALVGSGTRFDLYGKEYTTPYNSGYLTVKVGWSVDGEGNVLCPTSYTKSVDEKALAQKWPTVEKLDPNDPRNVRLDQDPQRPLSKSQPQQPSGVQTKFTHSDFETESRKLTLDSQMAEFDFCSMESLEKNPRFRLLQLRDEKVPEFRGIRMIPSSEYEIPPNIFDEYERREQEEANQRLGVPQGRFAKRQKHTSESTVFETNRLEKIREVRLAVLQLFENAVKQITFEDLVIEEQIPDIGTLGLNLMTIFQPKRPLRPIRKERKRVQGAALIDTQISLIVNIVRAFNLPIRKETTAGLMTAESVTGVAIQKKRSVTNTTSSNYATVKPFAEVWFQRNVSRTTTALGSNPTWNQEMQLPLTAANDDYSQANLSRMDDLIYLLVYDEIAIDLLEDDRRRDTDIYQRLQKRWLGSITIPFSTLYFNGRIEGTFKLNSPSLLLGYEQQGMATQFGANMASRTPSIPTSLNLTKGTTNVPISNQRSAYITLFITLQPTVSAGSVFKQEGATGETADMVSHVKSWQNLVHQKFPDRIIKPFVMSPDGDTVLCTRFLRPIEPPEGLSKPGCKLIRRMEDIAHYVSLFPTVRDSTLGISDYSLWFTSDAFVLTPGGGVEDHAVLLACYFMHLEIPCWIVQGNAIPHGLTTFVATSFKNVKEDMGVPKPFRNLTLLWNPCSGEYYSTTDSFCPLHKIWTVIGKLNMWANTSEFERPHQLEWDIEKSKQWSPLFSKVLPETKLPSLQSGHIKYKTPDQTQANSLAQRIERFLKESFMKWRTTSSTNWNRSCSAILRRLLPKLEDRRVAAAIESPVAGSNKESKTEFLSDSPSNLREEHLIELKEISTTFKMTGFPLQQPFVNFELLAEVLFATGVHTIDAPRTEFAIATYAKAYPSSVYSVWIYVASLHRENR